MFYVAPFALIALLGLAARDVVPRARWARATAALAAGVLPVAIPFDRFVNVTAVSDTFALLPWWWVQDHGIPFATLRWLALGVGLGAAAAFVALRRRFALVFPILVAAYFVVTTAVVENGRHGIQAASLGKLSAGIRLAHPDWVDRKVGRDANVTELWAGAGQIETVWENEFFNRSIRTIVDTGNVFTGGLPEQTLHERPNGELVRRGHGPLRVRYALVPVSTNIAGTTVASDPGTGLLLARVNGPLLVRASVIGLYPSDTWSGKQVIYRRRRCRGGYVSVLLQSDPNLFSSDQFVTASARGATVGQIRVAPAAPPRRFVVPLQQGTNETCTVRFTVSKLRVPARVQAGSTDTRSLGIHFLRFSYLP